LLQYQRDCGGDGQSEDERTFELAQEKAKSAQSRRIFHTIGSDKGKLRCGSIGCKSDRP
jgi:hypothetical protein